MKSTHPVGAASVRPSLDLEVSVGSPYPTYFGRVRGEGVQESGRFRRHRSNQELLAVIRQVIEWIGIEDPLTVTQVTFDEARCGAGHPRCPRAFRIARQFGLSWSNVLELALVSRNPDQELSAKTVVQSRDWLTRAEVEYYLERAAKHLGKRDLSLGDYEAAREELVAREQRGHSNAQVGLFPTGSMILHRVGTWTEAVAWAGLEEPARKTKNGYPAARALDDFIEDFGALPSRKALAEYQKARGVSTSGMPKGSYYTAWRARQMKSGPASRHKNVSVGTFKPGSLDRKRISPAPVGYAEPGCEPGTLDRVLQDLNTALDLTYGNLTQRRYGRLAVQHGLCSVATIQRIGKLNGGKTWADLRDQVIASRANRRVET